MEFHGIMKKVIRNIDWYQVLWIVLTLFVIGMLAGNGCVRNIFVRILSFMIFLCYSLYQLVHFPVLMMIMMIFTALLQLS